MSGDHGRKWAAGVRALILRRLVLYGPATPPELAAGLRMPHAAIAPRMGEMEADGTAYDTGERKRSESGLGRPAKVWAASA